MNSNDLMIHSSRETTKFTRPNRETFTLDFNDNASFENDKAFITFLMSMGQWITPGFFGIVVPNLQEC